MNINSKINWAARVAIQRYSPFTRREGMPINRPAAAATTPAKGMESQKEKPSRVTRMAEV